MIIKCLFIQEANEAGIQIPGVGNQKEILMRNSRKLATGVQDTRQDRMEKGKQKGGKNDGCQYCIDVAIPLMKVEINPSKTA